MNAAEAERLAGILRGRSDVSPLLNLGSSTREFRELRKPHIDAKLFAPLRQAGIEVFHSDLKKADGVDLAGDILDPGVRVALKARGFRCVLLSNLLEHVRDRRAVAEACADIVGPGGLILATVPRSYPFHADPIDTGYRPSPAKLAQAFPGTTVLHAEELVGNTYGEAMEARGVPPWRELLGTLGWLLIAPARPKSAWSRAHRWLWYRRPYSVSIVLLKVR